MDSEVKVFNGTRFRRYPQSEDRSSRVYFTPGIADKLRGIGRLHEEIWKAEHGAIPADCAIHHIDGNPLNNEIGNLACMPRSEHLSMHGKQRGYTDAMRKHLERIRPQTVEWHRSEAGREWHRQHARKTWEGVGFHRSVCEHCGTAFETRALHGNERFCSNACKTRYRFLSGVDNEQRTCPVCDKTFTVNRYVKKRYCSNQCVWVARRRQA